MTRTVHELERDLRQSGTSVLEPDRLAEIRRRGGRRRRGRRTALAGGVLAVVVAVGAGLAIGGSGDVARDRPPIAQQSDAPRVLSDLAKRALREIPGATKVSPWQVVIPGPDVPSDMEMEITADHIVGTPVDTGTRVYLGPTIFAKGTFPDWLYDGVEHIEQTDLASEDGHPVGSLEPGILVDYGAATLGCVSPYWDGADANGPCSPTLLVHVQDKWYLRWGMGTDRFLQTGAPMEVFQAPDFSTGSPTSLAIAGLDGTRVARADFISSDGTVTEGTVLAGTLVEGDTMLFANVPGELAFVIAYDADGEVVENHRLRDCDDPVDCEVR